MLITKLMGAQDYLAVQREAARILHEIIHALDVRPMPDGSVRFRFERDTAFLDRLAVWGTCAEDREDCREDDEDGADREPDARNLPKSQIGNAEAASPDEDAMPEALAA